MARIKQAAVAPALKFFKKDFLDSNNLVEYFDENAPAVFFGCKQLGKLIDSHKGIKLLLPSTPTDIPILESHDNVLLICSENYPFLNNVVKKHITPKIKNYDMFKPNQLGDKIYFYSGFKDGWNHRNNMIETIRKYTKFEMITTEHSKLVDYYDIAYLKQNFYDKCFINLNMTRGNGLATVIELGLMGRKTVFNNPNKNSIQRLEFPNFINYQDIAHIVKIIEEESKKIGTIQQPIDAHNVGDEWLDLDYWL